MSAVVWVKDCPFNKVEKPLLPISPNQIDALYQKLCGNWLEIRDDLGVEKARMRIVDLSLILKEVACIQECLIGVLQECHGDPLELELRVGIPNEVENLLSRFNQWLV